MKYSASIFLSALYAAGVSAQYGGGGGFENPAPNDGTVDNGNNFGSPVTNPAGDENGNNFGNPGGDLNNGNPNPVENAPPNGVVDSLPNTETSAIPNNGGGINNPSTQSERGVVNCRNQICYSMAIPQSTSGSGSGNIFFQIYAPDTFSWVGMGTGNGMADSNMFIIYQDGQGNVTVSGRQASGYTMPTVPTQNAPLIELLEGSGVGNGIMMANFRCINCDSWKNSQLDFASTSEPMMGAWQTGDPLNSNDINAQIGKHTGNVRSFAFDTTQARITNDQNPFVGVNAVPAEVNENTNENNNGNGENAGAGSSDLLKRGLGLAVIVAALPLLAF